jgi:hypothetical protein
MLNEQLERTVEFLPLIKQLFEHDVYITVMDTAGVVCGYSIPDGTAPQLQVGDTFTDPSGAFDAVIRTGEKKHNYLPKEVMGEAFEGILAPVKDGGKTVGCIICTYSVGSRERMADVTSKFQSSVGNINDAIHTMVEGIENLFNMLSSMNEMTTNVEGDVQNAVSIVNKISSNASRSNILALNASIEAARSGEYGRGFAVVASEMGKLANDSGSSASDIKETLSTITTHLASIISSIKEANNDAKIHMESISKIQGILDQTMQLANEMESDIKNQ